jgi:preprotein translocase subunit SecE
LQPRRPLREHEAREDDRAEDAGTDEAISEEDAEDAEEEAAANQLGAQRYVTAGFFAAGLLGAFILGKTIHALWANLAGRDWFASALPSLAAFEDGTRSSFGMLIGVVVAALLVIRLYRRADVREWTDDVAGELAKVKWPTRKDVYNSTVVVIAASAIFTTYLALLDRLWAFVTNLVYGTGV